MTIAQLCDAIRACAYTAKHAKTPEVAALADERARQYLRQLEELLR